MSKEQVIDALTERVLIGRGWEVDDRELDMEWDRDNPDSQYSLVREDMVIAVDALEELGLLSF